MSHVPALVNRGGHALRAELFGMIHARRDTRPFIRNIQADVEILRVDDQILPATVTHGEPGNAWICSPRDTWCEGPAMRLDRQLGPALARCASGLYGMFGRVLDRASIDRAVTLNSWLLDSAFYPPVRRSTLGKSIEAALERWPQHALWFRWLNEERNASLIAALRAAGFALLPTRRVWLFDGIGLKLRMASSLQRDLQFLHRTQLWPVGRTEIYPADFARIAALHAATAAGPGWRQPQYTARFMQYWHQAGLLDFRGFRGDDGLLQAVAGIFRIGDNLSAPIFGFDTASPRASALHRLLMARLLEEAMLSNATLVLGPGQAAYKLQRGGRPLREYSAVLARHLPLPSRRGVALLQSVAARFGPAPLQAGR